LFCLSLTLFPNSSPTDGTIEVKAPLDRERTSKHILVVSAKDQGSPAKANFARVTVTVADDNDHAPTFLSPLIQTKLHESADVGSEVVEVLAVDIDRGDNGRISYAIASGNVGNSFNVDADLGVVRVARRLNMVVQGEYMLVVRATDHGQVPKSATVPLHILLTMGDDAAPVFTR
jgi:protocadherin Fat 1/2/3